MSVTRPSQDKAQSQAQVYEKKPPGTTTTLKDQQVVDESHFQHEQEEVKFCGLNLGLLKRF